MKISNDGDSDLKSHLTRDYKRDKQKDRENRQGRIHGTTVTDGYTGAVMQKNRWRFKNVTDRWSYRRNKVRSRVSANKKKQKTDKLRLWRA